MASSMAYCCTSSTISNAHGDSLRGLVSSSSSSSTTSCSAPCVSVIVNQQLHFARRPWVAGTIPEASLCVPGRRRRKSISGTRAAERTPVRCAAGSDSKVGFFGKLGRVIKEKAKGDIDRLFNGFAKTRENLSVVDELLTYWNLSDSEETLEELEEALLVSDFGPRTALKIVEDIRKDILAAKLTTGDQIKTALKTNIVKLLTSKIGSTDLQLGTSKPAVILVIGVNGGGKTTTIGKLAHRLKKVESVKVLMAAGDTFRAAASEQLEVWADRTNSDIEMGAVDKRRPAAVLAKATQRAVDEGYDVLLADTSGRLHTNFNLMEELRNCKRSVSKVLPGAPNEVLMVLDGTTGLNMLPQAREFNQVAGITGFVVTKLDGTSRGGCVVSVVDELGIPVKFIGVGEKLDDLQPFDPETFVNALFPEKTRRV